MSKIVTLRLDKKIYDLFWKLAKSDNRPLSNFIETSALRFIESNEYVDDFEMEEIQNNKDLNSSLKKALKDVKNKKGKMVEL